MYRGVLFFLSSVCSVCMFHTGIEFRASHMGLYILSVSFGFFVRDAVPQTWMMVSVVVFTKVAPRN